MKREAWAAINSVTIKDPNINHQVLSNEIVDALHEAGFVIVPHETTDEMVTAGVRTTYWNDISDPYLCVMNVYQAMLSNHIDNRQQSES